MPLIVEMTSPASAIRAWVTKGSFKSLLLGVTPPPGAELYWVRRVAVKANVRIENANTVPSRTSLIQKCGRAGGLAFCC